MKMTCFLLLVSALLILSKAVSGAKIIMTAPQFLSHINRQLELGSELVRQGHEVYVAVGSRFPRQEMITSKGMTILLYHFQDDIMYGVSKEFEQLLEYFVFNDLNILEGASKMTHRDCVFMMEDKRFLESVRNLNFDLAVVEPFILGQCSLLLPAYLGIPYISMTANVQPWKFRIPALPSFVPPMAKFDVFPESSFMARVDNLINYIFTELGIFFTEAQNTTLLERYAPEIGSWGELLRNSELFLITSDHHMIVPLPAFPNVVTIAGLSCRPAEKLNPQLESMIASNEHGTIVMSFGSMLHHIPKYVLVKFLEAFSRLEETVVARISLTEDIEIPKNVHLVTWMPQNDILGHANTKLFITHCGSSGLYEAIYHEVPVIGFPLFYDQITNCRVSAEKGFGLVMNIHDFTADELFNNIKEVRNNSRYKSAIRAASERFRDQPMSAREKAVFWVEYVMKHGGHHLRSPANDLPLYQFLMLDILAAIFVIGLVIIYFAKYTFNMLLRQINVPKYKTFIGKTE